MKIEVLLLVNNLAKGLIVGLLHIGLVPRERLMQTSRLLHAHSMTTSAVSTAGKQVWG